jgi:hypothetical protein
LKFNLIESIFKITNKVETKSDINFSAYLFLAKICSENELENEFNKILNKYENYLKQCADEFKNKDSENIQRTCREIMIDDELKEKKFFSLDMDQCGIETTLNLILNSLELFCLSGEKIATIIYDCLQSYFDILLEKGETYEKRLVLDIYIEISLYGNREMKKFSEQIQKALIESKEYSKVFESKLKIFGLITGFEYEMKKTQNHDGITRNVLQSKKQENDHSPHDNHKRTILISFDSNDDKIKYDELKKRLEKIKFNVWMTNKEGGIFLTIILILYNF